MFHIGALVTRAKYLATGPTLIPVTVLHLLPVDPRRHMRGLHYITACNCNIILYMFLVLQPTVEDIPALSAVEDLPSSLQVQFAVMRLVGGLRLEDNVT